MWHLPLLRSILMLRKLIQKQFAWFSDIFTPTCSWTVLVSNFPLSEFQIAKHPTQPLCKLASGTAFVWQSLTLPHRDFSPRFHLQLVFPCQEENKNNFLEPTGFLSSRERKTHKHEMNGSEKVSLVACGRIVDCNISKQSVIYGFLRGDIFGDTLTPTLGTASCLINRQDSFELFCSNLH